MTPPTSSPPYQQQQQQQNNKAQAAATARPSILKVSLSSIFVVALIFIHTSILLPSVSSYFDITIPHFPSIFSPPRKISVSKPLSTTNEPHTDQHTQQQQQHQQQCIVMTHAKAPLLRVFPFNSRTFCRSSTPLCVSHDALYGFNTPSTTTCHTTTSSLRHRLQRPMNCSALHQSVVCTHGFFPTPTESHCPSTQAAIPPFSESSQTWHNATAVVIPAYPHQGNIFHFTFVIATAFHLGREQIIHTNSPRHLLLIFRGHNPYQLNNWQSWVTEALQSHLAQSGITSSIHALTDGPLRYTTDLHQLQNKHRRQNKHDHNKMVCARAGGVLMGPRDNVNLWAFPTAHGTPAHHRRHTRNYNASSIFGKGDKVISATPSQSILDRLRLDKSLHIPAESLRLRGAVYSAAKISTSTSTLTATSSTMPRTLKSSLPPLTLSYARRNVGKDPAPGQIASPTRRLSDADEDFLISLLTRLSLKHGFSYSTLQFSNDSPMYLQVSSFVNSGIVIGLHGANLLNSMFMYPLSALIEVTPLGLPCYAAGGNAGLVSWIVRPSRSATPVESSCPTWLFRCWKSPVERRVLLEDDAVREELEATLLETIMYIKEIRNRFDKLGYIPLILHERSASYVVDWDNT